MKKIAIYGSGGFGREVKMLIEQINAVNNQWYFVGFFDDYHPIGTCINGANVIGGSKELNSLQDQLYLVFAIGDPSLKKKIFSEVNNHNIIYPLLIHPSVWVGNDNVTIGQGSIITAGNILTVDINIGDHVILNLGCTVGHDTKIGSFSSFMPSVNISGEVLIEESVYVGTGAKIINQIEIGCNSIIGAGAVVSKSIPANCTAVGVPAKPIKFHDSN